MTTLNDFLLDLKSKGFHFGEDAKGFIHFGKQYTGASDELVNTAIELTLKAQIKFDGSFYLSLLETFKVNKIQNRNEAIHFLRKKQLLVL